MKVALDERIAAAFNESIRLADVADLIAEAEAAVVSSGDAAERARTIALDPALSAADVAAARRDMDDAAFRRDRMQVAAQRLGERLREVRRQEDQARRRAAYDAALVERDALAAELAAVYPGLAAQLADLVAQIAANDAVIEGINRKQLPDGADRLACAEVVARHLRGGFMDGTAQVPRITEQMRLPAFNYFGHAPYTWPRRER